MRYNYYNPSFADEETEKESGPKLVQESLNPNLNQAL